MPFVETLSARIQRSGSSCTFDGAAGIGEEAAKSLLTYAFARDVVDRIKAAPVRHELEELLLARLPKGDVVRQAL